MKRLAMVDGLLFATFAVFLVSLAVGFGGRLETVALAQGPFQDCLPPVICPAVGGNCAGCAANPGATGNCFAVTYNIACAQIRGGGCRGKDQFGVACSCSTSVC